MFLLFFLCFGLCLLLGLHKLCGFKSNQAAAAASSQLPPGTTHCGPCCHHVVGGTSSRGNGASFLIHSSLSSVSCLSFQALRQLGKYFPVLNSPHLVIWHGLCLLPGPSPCTSLPPVKPRLFATALPPCPVLFSSPSPFPSSPVPQAGCLPALPQAKPWPLFVQPLPPPPKVAQAPPLISARPTRCDSWGDPF